MSILIKNAEMPTSCLECPLTDGHSASCLITEKSVYFSVDKRHDGCPLVPVPPHGRLIDADALLKGCERVATEYATREYAFSQSAIENAPTIIPAEEGHE